MAATRYYYSDSIGRFLTRSVNEIVGELTLASQHDINDETSQSWVEEIMTLREALAPYSGHGSIYFEYNIPRMGRRVDVIALIDGIDEAKGLTPGNLYYCKQFYSLYNQLFEIVPQVGEIFHYSLNNESQRSELQIVPLDRKY